MERLLREKNLENAHVVANSGAKDGVPGTMWSAQALIQLAPKAQLHGIKVYKRPISPALHQ